MSTQTATGPAAFDKIVLSLNSLEALESERKRIASIPAATPKAYAREQYMLRLDQAISRKKSPGLPWDCNPQRIDPNHPSQRRND